MEHITPLVDMSGHEHLSQDKADFIKALGAAQWSPNNLTEIAEEQDLPRSTAHDGYEDVLKHTEIKLRLSIEIQTCGVCNEQASDLTKMQWEHEHSKPETINVCPDCKSTVSDHNRRVSNGP